MMPTYGTHLLRNQETRGKALLMMTQQMSVHWLLQRKGDDPERETTRVPTQMIKYHTSKKIFLLIYEILKFKLIN